MIGDKHKLLDPLAAILGDDFRACPATPEGIYTDYPEWSKDGEGVDDWRWAQLGGK